MFTLLLDFDRDCLAEQTFQYKVALRYAEALRNEGFDVWWDQTLNAGEAHDEVTEKALDDESVKRYKQQR